jgi:hypothetical protein
MDALMRCRASQRRFRNTLLFIAPDDAQLGNAREVMRKAIAWAEIAGDKRLRDQLPSGQIRDAEEKAKSNRESAQKAVRGAWSHIFYPVKSDVAGKPFDLEHSLISARERRDVPTVVYDKAKADGIVLEKLGSERLWHALKPIWPEDRPHLPIAEVAEWFASYVYLPRLRDRVVLDGAIRDPIALNDPDAQRSPLRRPRPGLHRTSRSTGHASGRAYSPGTSELTAAYAKGEDRRYRHAVRRDFLASDP